MTPHAPVCPHPRCWLSGRGGWLALALTVRRRRGLGGGVSTTRDRRLLRRRG
jgi:hypothetical protein